MASRFWVGGSGTWDGSTTTNWASTSGGAGGVSVPGSSDTVTLDGNSGASAVITVNTNINISLLSLGSTGGQFTGTLDFATHNNSFTGGGFGFSGSGTRTLNMGTNTFTLTGTNFTVWDFGTTSGLTLDAGTSTIYLNVGGGTNNGRTMSFGSQTFNNLTIGANYGGSGGSSMVVSANNINGNPTFNGTFTITGPACVVIPNGGSVTCANLTINPTFAPQFTYLGCAARGVSGTLSCSGTVSASNVCLENIHASGSSAPFSASSSIDLGGNYQWNISAPTLGSGVVGVIGS